MAQKKGRRRRKLRGGGTRTKEKLKISSLCPLHLHLPLSLSSPFPNQWNRSLLLQKKTKKTKEELSYPLHVILRVEIEAALLRGEMKVGDVPRVWGEKMRASLGCEPPSDDGRVNCLQDM